MNVLLMYRGLCSLYQTCVENHSRHFVRNCFKNVVTDGEIAGYLGEWATIGIVAPRRSGKSLSIVQFIKDNRRLRCLIVTPVKQQAEIYMEKGVKATSIRCLGTVDLGDLDVLIVDEWDWLGSMKKIVRFCIPFVKSHASRKRPFVLMLMSTKHLEV